MGTIVVTVLKEWETTKQTYALLCTFVSVLFNFVHSCVKKLKITY